MPFDLTDKVAVASGSAERVKKWSQALQAASVPFTVVKCLSANDTNGRSDQAELWVYQDDADKARTVIKAVPVTGAPPIW
jgi:hypothetical protein